MATKKIALDAGHGLRTSGKQTPDGIKEWTLNDKVRDKVVKLLDGYDVAFIFPDKNEGYNDESLASRVKAYTDAGADAVVSIHHNAYTGKWNDATGVEVFTDRNATTKDLRLADCIYGRLVKYTGLKGRGIKAEDWWVINQDKIPAVLVEGGFMDGRNDYKVITSEKWQDAYARAVAEGLIEFLGLKKKVEKTEGTFKVKFKTDMNVRSAPGVGNKITATCKKNYIYTITETKYVGDVPWGKLLSGAGWVSIHSNYCTRV